MAQHTLTFPAVRVVRPPHLPAPLCERACRWWASAASTYSFAAGFAVALYPTFGLWVPMVLALTAAMIVRLELGRGR